MAKLTLHILLNLLVFTAFAGDLPTPVRTYKDWKSDKIQVVQTKLTQLKAQLDNIKSSKLLDAKDNKGGRAASYDSLIRHYEQEFNQVQWNLEVAKDLSVTDYVVLYLGTQSSKSRFQEAAAHLAPAEVAELLEAYSNAMGPSTSQPIGAPNAALRASSAGLLSK